MKSMTILLFFIFVTNLMTAFDKAEQSVVTHVIGNEGPLVKYYADAKDFKGNRSPAIVSNR